ncbi:LOW QUALITY PROTEIN: hypothetical protein BT93_L0946 [Corymbia citriodora subsp. variegata]|uniref:TIR domain-containing protein n=1 Tax=Corymbia citriodora subsp. variegata TaxID=360336 RepID=A0A8T0CXR7_CORYI|nr:LOW QUALITY PROTEIN: hypothetical protein BT93_L0946 [Corymbia citriodora subsp. variegata]
MEKPTESGYEVFLSFRGPDTRLDIADYLYNSLIHAGIRAYRDNEELPIGEEIGPELVQAIKQSEISIPILSKGYAASPWCLMELVQMVECKEKWGRKIMPVFYNVAPSEVRYQTGSYGEAINLHINKRRYTDETIQNWKVALSKVGALRGWELKERGKGEFTEEVVRKILIELKKNYLAVSNCLVEMDDQVDQIMEKIGEQTTGTKIVGIYGMGGVGKTTLATIIYNKLSADFDNCCFLTNIRETKIESLQNQLISKVLRMEWPSINSINEGITEIKKRLSSKKVLLVLDDVDQNTQLEALVGQGECWFGRGSKVIITTRNEEVLKDVNLKHELTEMDFNHSLLLFSKHAFRRDHPPAEYIPLSEKAVEICGRLPLALEIIGSFLAGKDRKFWVDSLERLKTIPNKKVKSKLNISFEALEPQEKEIFLDVCCFFVGFDVRIVTYMWDSCKFFPEYSLEVLKQMSLIKIVEGNRLWVHDQLRDLGRDIIRERADFKLEKQSRVWNHDEAIDVLKRKEGTENVEAICLKFDHQSQCFFKKEEFARLSNLRFLRVECGDLDTNNIQHFSLTNWFRRNLPIPPNLRWLSLPNFIQHFPSTNLFLRNLLILSELKWLSWHRFIQYFPSTNWFRRNVLILQNLRYLSWHEFPLFYQLTAFSHMKLVILDLSRSKITDNWEGWNHLKMAKNLKVLNLTECRNLRGTPDFSSQENLEQLILRGCPLVQIDRSIGKLKHLTLPDEMDELEALTELLVDSTSITNIPEWKGMKKLKTLSAVACRSLSVCNFSGCLTSLLTLSLDNTRITELPFGNFGSLVELNLSNSSIRELPDSIGKMKNLRVLRMHCTHLRKLPSALGMLEKLEEIDAGNCRNLEEIPSEIGRLTFLRILRLSDTIISEVPKLPESLTNLYITTRSEMRLPDLSNLLILRVLELGLMSGTLFHTAPSLHWIGGLRKLESLMLCCHSLATLPSDVNLLSKLRKLDLLVDKLECLPRLPQNLSHFRIFGLMEKSIDLSYLEKLSKLEVNNCEQLIEIQGLEHLKNLKYLDIESLPSLVKLFPDSTNLKKLTGIWILNCPKLVEVRGQLESLEILYIMSCESLEKLPDPLSFKNIEQVLISGCWKLEEIQGLEDSEYLKYLNLRNLPSLVKLPDLTNCKKLELLNLVNCPGLVEIQGRLESLERLSIYHCGSLQKLSDPSSFKNLASFYIGESEKFEETLESEEYRDLKKLARPTKEIGRAIRCAM